MNGHPKTFHYLLFLPISQPLLICHPKMYAQSPEGGRKRTVLGIAVCPEVRTETYGHDYSSCMYVTRTYLTEAGRGTSYKVVPPRAASRAP